MTTTPQAEAPQVARKKGKAKPEGEATRLGSLKEAGIEAYEVVEVHRKELANAEYNPRVMTDAERCKLKKALKKHGLVAPITWNRRTGRIVGGHQRIGITDSLMGTADYTLKVAAIDVDEAREKELNVLLNNQHAMGSFDLPALKEMFKDANVTLEGAGLDVSDMIHMFGDDSLNDRQEDLSELSEKLGALSREYTAIQAANKQKTSNEFFLILVFPDAQHVDAVLRKLRLQDNRYQSGVHFMHLLGIKPEDAEEPEEAHPEEKKPERPGPILEAD